MPFGLSTTGFTPKTLTDIKAELEAAFRAAFGASIDVSSTSNFGQLIGIMADRFSELWDLAQAVYKAFDPDAATGASLVQIGAITGTIPRAATKSQVTPVFTGTNGTSLTAGRVISVETIGTKFVTLTTTALATATAWAISTAYAVGDVRQNDSGKIYYCASAGTSAGSGGPTGTAFSITDGTVTWRYIGPGPAYAKIACESQETGPRIAAAGTLTVIETSVSGWSAVKNPDDAVLGENAESDAEFRERREQELLGESRSTVESIRVRVSNDVDGAFGVIVFENSTDSTNGDGMPPHSVEVLVRGGIDQDILEVVWANVAAGITTHGNTSGTVTDEDNGGQTYTVKFSRPDEKNIWVIANVVKDPLTFPADGADQIKASILAHGNAYRTGRDVHSSALKAACFGSTKEVDGALQYVPIPGVLNAATVYIGLSASPASEASLTMALRDLAVFDSARITVNVSDATP